MGFQKIDYAAWPRRPYFEHYHRDVPCWYSMTVDVDISALLPRLRGSGLRFYPSVIHGISRMVNADPALRMAMDETGAIGVYDRVDPTYTIFHKDDETFSVLWTAYQPDLRAFCQDWEADRARYGDIHTFEARPPGCPWRRTGPPAGEMLHGLPRRASASAPARPGTASAPGAWRGCFSAVGSYGPSVRP